MITRLAKVEIDNRCRNDTRSVAGLAGGQAGVAL